MMSFMKSVISAEGFWTRFLPAIKSQPEKMLSMYNNLTIQYVVEETVNQGFDDILIVTGGGKRSIENHFGRSLELDATLENADKYDCLQLVHDITGLTDICYIG